MLNCAFHESPIDWHRDPQTGRQAPRRFALDINLRDPTLVGNIKYLWEKNRHHHLTVLALAHALTGDERYADEVHAQLTSWLAENPFPIGVNWASSLELGVRLLAWVWIERMLRGARAHPALFGPAGAMWPAVYWHQWMIGQHPSHGSSANNHRIGEMSGLFCAACAWPVFAESAGWRERARRALEHESRRQTFPSGVNRELAFGYQIFTVECFLLALLAQPADFSPQFYRQVQRMIEVIPRLTDVGGNLPRYGDGDDGRAVQLQALGASRATWLCQVGHALVGADVPEHGDTKLPTVLLGAGAPVLDVLPEETHPLAIQDAGLYVLSSARDSAQEIFVLADAGPLGFGPMAAHAHADALAFTLSVGGQPVLVDPGTYDYLSEPRWRDYFRSTRAHNTVVIDGRDQSTPAGPFLWIQPARTTVHRWSVAADGAVLTASHDGYARRHVTHVRRFELRGRTLTIADELAGWGTHDVLLCFHAAPECQVELTSPATVSLTREGLRVGLTLPAELKVEVARGRENAGWYSSGYGLKQETFTVLAGGHVRLPVLFTTRVEIGSVT